ncbi:MAG: hypothetical protein M3R54_13170 [Chloroflexota bacterium]|nr:hypothetical protein [Chloroflexota bacterium]
MNEKERSPLPLRATGIVLGLWMAAVLAIAFFVVPALFASCLPSGNPVPSPTP